MKSVRRRVIVPVLCWLGKGLWEGGREGGRDHSFHLELPMCVHACVRVCMGGWVRVCE